MDVLFVNEFASLTFVAIENLIYVLWLGEKGDRGVAKRPPLPLSFSFKLSCHHTGAIGTGGQLATIVTQFI